MYRNKMMTAIVKVHTYYNATVSSYHKGLITHSSLITPQWCSSVKGQGQSRLHLHPKYEIVIYLEKQIMPDHTLLRRTLYLAMAPPKRGHCCIRLDSLKGQYWPQRASAFTIDRLGWAFRNGGARWRKVERRACQLACKATGM
jgi:hypothetical protein